MIDFGSSLRQHWQSTQLLALQAIDRLPARETAGRVTRVTGLVMEARGISLPIGSPCEVVRSDGRILDAEVVGFEHGILYLMPLDDIEGVTPGAAVVSAHHVLNAAEGRRLPVGQDLLGRVVDAAGRPLDGLGPIQSHSRRGLHATAINPLSRDPIREPLDVGVRAINGLLAIGRGQRIGLFAGSGVGKSVLLGMMARYTVADVIVVGLIGERGREVKEFIDEILGPDGLARSVVVAAPADVSPLLRLQGAAYATTLAESFRDQGKSVLLIMDSLTRYAMAQREIALSIGEAPATKGYPPSVFAKMPALVERAGNGQGGGSITAFYTVLTEGDDQQDPIADAARAILDGHIVLNRSLAEAGHYPAIDIEQSISRVMQAISDPEHQAHARRLKQLFSRHQRSRDLIQVGAYAPGHDPQLDEALARMPRIEAFLNQGMQERAGIAQSLRELQALFEGSA